ncbi:efflux transporter, outer membrane factor (OMF) lipo, NodT family protein [Collimonas pratensis]|uniref:Efflux transporter, outer membrane factor (OMF) lipo, NodT family protein n=1 Tax=Collimonas pratensis TaxID=279113 RepID=A0ABN4M3V2_9BURK|nr:efflux transporter, outer membrane factor (OMF) lipo, NodT family protein [Collimonas pratensis]
MTPAYDRPGAAAPARFKEDQAAPQESGSWKKAEPSEQIARGAWWTVFSDEKLNRLESEALSNNQDLKAAAARLAQANAARGNARASLFPAIDVGFGATRQKVSPDSLYLPAGADSPEQTLWRAQAGISYETDLFGRVSATISAATADVQQSEALFRSVLLALQASVAQNYFNLRQLDSEIDVLKHAAGLREQTLKLVQRRFDEGYINELDVVRARSELALARSDEMSVLRQRAAAEHGLAALLGKVPAEFSVAENLLSPVTVQIPAGLPSSLLERRPDIAAAERAMAAANARIGVARAAFFPSLSLTGNAGFESASFDHLFRWSSRTFLLGPLVGTALSLPIFDGGARDSVLAGSRAKYEEDVANYRQHVLTAFQEVEDNLANLRILREQVTIQDSAIEASSRAAQLSRRQYNEGSISFLDVLDAERSELTTQRTRIRLQGALAASTVNLVRALGGGWGNANASTPRANAPTLLNPS